MSDVAKTRGAGRIAAFCRPTAALLFAPAALALQWAMWGVLQPYVWLFFYPAVFFTSWVGGKRWGIAATIFSAVSAWWFFMPPERSFAVERVSTGVALGIFTGMGVLFSFTHEQLKQALREAASTREHLEELIGSRTDELSHLVDELRAKESDLKKSQEIAKVGSWSYDLSGALTWSDELFRIYGLEPGSISPDVGYFFDIIHPDDRQTMEQWIAACMAGESPGALEFRVILPDGKVRVISGRGELSYLGDGTPARMSGTAQDVTDRKEAESALRESREQLLLFIEFAPVPLAMFDRDMRYIYASRRWRSDYGVGEESVQGKSHYEIFPDLPASWREVHRRGLDGEILREEADRFERADGTVLWIRWEVRPWHDASGNIGGIVIFSEDITERKNAEDELHHLNEDLEARVAQRTEELDRLLEMQEAQNAELQEAYHELEAETAERIRILEELRNKDQLLIHQSRLAAMGEMLGYIAHQWRQPLNLLGLHLQVLDLAVKRGTFTEALLEENVGKGMEIIKHLSRTIDDFRDFLVLNKEKKEFAVNEVIEKTVGLVSDKLKGEEIAVEMLFDGDPRITGFPNEYSHVVLNLLSNARDAFLERGIAGARIVIRSGVEDGKTVVTVTDNAGGIPEEIVDKIFDAYFTTKGVGKGSGVGLFMSKMIIESNMSGRLTARNVPGGAEFRIEV